MKRQLAAAVIAVCLGGSSALAAPNDPGLPLQWALAGARVLDVWSVLPTVQPETVVAVVDGGVDLGHPDLRDRLWAAPRVIPGPPTCAAGSARVGSHGYDLIDCDDRPAPEPVPDGSRPEPGYSHGTKVAGIIGASSNNGIAVAGVAPAARIMALRVCTSRAASCSQSRELEAAKWAAAAGARVVNISLGGPTTSLPGQARFRAAFDAFPDTLFVIAAGNDGLDIDDAAGANNAYPCEIPAENVICVANLTRSDELDPSSNVGAQSVDIAAPGTGILTLAPIDATVPNVTEGSGTSEAAPMVSGVAAILMSAVPMASANAVKRAILGSARQLPGLRGNVLSGGALDARAALERLRAESVVVPVPARPPAVGKVSVRALGPGRVLVTFRLNTGGATTAWQVRRRGPTGDTQVARGSRSVPGRIDVTLVGRKGATVDIRLLAQNGAGRVESPPQPVRFRT